MYYGIGSVLLQNKMLDDYVRGDPIPKGPLIRKLRLRISNRKSKPHEFKDTDTFSWVSSRARIDDLKSRIDPRRIVRKLLRELWNYCLGKRIIGRDSDVDECSNTGERYGS